ILCSVEDLAGILAREPDFTKVLYINAGSNHFALVDTARALSSFGGNVKLWVITSGAHQVTVADPPANMFQASAWGLARAIVQREMPGIWGGLVDVSRDASQCEIEAALVTILAQDGEDQLAIRGQETFLLRLGRLGVNPSTKVSFRRDGAYVVTGAF